MKKLGLVWVTLAAALFMGGVGCGEGETQGVEQEVETTFPTEEGDVEASESEQDGGDEEPPGGENPPGDEEPPGGEEPPGDENPPGDEEPAPKSCELNAECPQEGYYCQREAGCQEAGICVKIPEEQNCGMAITPYCDCEGNQQESNNTCVYEPYLHLGRCEDQGGVEGCETNADCPNIGDYCKRPEGCQELGVCEPIPADIMCNQVMTPYCDCKGNSQESPTSCIWDAYMNRGGCLF